MKNINNLENVHHASRDWTIFVLTSEVNKDIQKLENKSSLWNLS